MPSIEDLLISEYSENNSGEIYKEVPVGKIENKKRQRRIDALLIEGNKSKIHEQGGIINRKRSDDTKGTEVLSKGVEFLHKSELPFFKEHISEFNTVFINYERSCILKEVQKND